MNRHINIIDAHWNALNSIRDDAAIGRLPCYDYAIEFYDICGATAPEPPLELIQYLEGCEPISGVEYSRNLIKRTYAEHELDIPIGLMDLPAWWTPAIIQSINEINWVEPAPERTKTTFGWQMVHVQGAYLDIQFNDPLPSDAELWHPIASELINLHKRLEPGPFTQIGRLKEFF